MARSQICPQCGPLRNFRGAARANNFTWRGEMVEFRRNWSPGFRDNAGLLHAILYCRGFKRTGGFLEYRGFAGLILVDGQPNIFKAVYGKKSIQMKLQFALTHLRSNERCPTVSKLGLPSAYIKIWHQVRVFVSVVLSLYNKIFDSRYFRELLTKLDNFLS